MAPFPLLNGLPIARLSRSLPSKNQPFHPHLFLFPNALLPPITIITWFSWCRLLLLQSQQSPPAAPPLAHIPFPTPSSVIQGLHWVFLFPMIPAFLHQTFSPSLPHVPPATTCIDSPLSHHASRQLTNFLCTSSCPKHDYTSPSPTCFQCCQEGAPILTRMGDLYFMARVFSKAYATPPPPRFPLTRAVPLLHFEPESFCPSPFLTCKHFFSPLLPFLPLQSL